MIVRNDIQQHSQEWHEIRYAKVSGTRNSGLFVESDTLFLEILAELTEPFNDSELSDFISKDMQRGNDLEKFARIELNKQKNLNLKEVGWCQSEKYKLLGISPDGISDDETVMCEIKCPKRKKHTETYLTNEIPKDNINQCLHYFMVNPKLETLYFVSFRPENLIYPTVIIELNKGSFINLGTPSKPQIKPISEWVEIGYEKIEALQNKLNEKLIEL